MSFAVNMVLQYAKVGPWKNYLYGERAYIILSLVAKTLRAAKEFKAKSISLSGGVAANESLRSELNLKSKIFNLNFFVPEKNLCTDNAEMIGIAAAFMLHNGFQPKTYQHISADSNLEL